MRLNKREENVQEKKLMMSVGDGQRILINIYKKIGKYYKRNCIMHKLLRVSLDTILNESEQ